MVPKGAEMVQRMMPRIATIGMLFIAFTLGSVCGSVGTPHATAQLPGGLGNPLAAAGQLGSSIKEMEEHVSGLQKNLEALKKVPSVLTGK